MSEDFSAGARCMKKQILDMLQVLVDSYRKDGYAYELVSDIVRKVERCD